jgi:photosystem II stability/assembly factor-like uncharacterized protein
VRVVIRTVKGGVAAISVLWALAGVHTAHAGINVWTSHGPGAMPVNVLAIDPLAPGTLYAGTGFCRDSGCPGRGVFKSTDGGGSWRAANGGLLDGAGVLALAIDPNTPSTLYASTSRAGHSINKSTDSGETWKAADIGLSGTDVYALAIDPTTPSTLYAGVGVPGVGGGGVFKSTDAGATWNAASTGLPDAIVQTLAIDPNTPGTLYAGTAACLGFGCPGSGVFKSTDGGASWRAVNTGLPADASVNALVVDPLTPGTLYAGASGVYGVFKSTDGGDSWRTVPVFLPNVYVLAIDPITPDTLYAVTGLDGIGGVSRSTDGGVTWETLNTGLPEGIGVIALALDPATPGTLFAGTTGIALVDRESSGGVYKSTDGATSWQAVNAGLSNTGIGALAIHPTAPGTLYAEAGRRVYESTDGATSWQGVDFPGLPLFEPINPGTLYAVDIGRVFKSTNGGATWEAANAGLDNTTYVSALVIDSTAPGTLYASGDPYVSYSGPSPGGGIFKSTDAAATWEAANAGLPNEPPLSFTFVSALAFEPTAPGTLYAAAWGLSSGVVSFGVFKSTDAANSWQRINTGLPDSPHVNVLAIDPIIPGTVYAGATTVCASGSCSDGVFKSTDGGGSWRAVGAGLPATSINALAIDPIRSSTLYAGTGSCTQDPVGGEVNCSGGVFKSTNGGVTWTAFNPGLDDRTRILALAIDPGNPARLYAGTADGGVLAIEQVGPCAGDCDDSGDVRVNEIVTLVNIGLGDAPPSACPHGVPDGIAVDIGLIIEAVNNGLDSCRFTAE